MSNEREAMARWIYRSKSAFHRLSSVETLNRAFTAWLEDDLSQL